MDAVNAEKYRGSIVPKHPPQRSLGLSCADEQTLKQRVSKRASQQQQGEVLRSLKCIDFVRGAISDSQTRTPKKLFIVTYARAPS